MLHSPSFYTYYFHMLENNVDGENRELGGK